MFFDLPDLLGPYLLPLLIAVPLAIVVFIISTRRGDDRDVGAAPPVPSRPALPKAQDLPAVPVAPAQAPAPFANESAPAVPAATQAEPAKPAPAVLLVDDSAVARAKLGKLFEGAGYRVTLAKDGLEALDRLAEQHFSVMVTDLEMPNKDGFELIADVQGSMATEDLPIIAITGHDEMQARVHQVQGLYGIFKKPWNDRELLKRVETLSNLRPAARQ
ncbi:PleD family two-component system response regulator [Paucibacter sp. Y2R2-4]|uniref:response regulator n=1 Tax=Paucibacter sp. Y2R2-4 TaxID=2893553 RepID=UPI0021E3B9F4|nr:response regulator [Paucibacter sp. Y2R2-4]MCV2350717.1 response regulator [Paucibacter sp. Y2R2-4]